MLALALVLEGSDRTTAANTCGRDRQTLRDWVHRYNQDGLAGLRKRAPPGAQAKLTEAQKMELARLVEAGPDRARAWRRAVAARRPARRTEAALRG